MTAELCDPALIMEPKEYQLHHPTLESCLTGTLNRSGSVVGYRGIPYAQIGTRWTRAIPHEPLTPSFDARSFGYVQIFRIS
jgi:carboxylesterase type B